MHAGFNLTLITGEVPPEVVRQTNIDKAMKRSFIGLRGAPAIVKGAEEFSAHHYAFPDAKLLKQLVSRCRHSDCARTAATPPSLCAQRLPAAAVAPHLALMRRPCPIAPAADRRHR